MEPPGNHLLERTFSIIKQLLLVTIVQDIYLRTEVSVVLCGGPDEKQQMQGADGGYPAIIYPGLYYMSARLNQRCRNNTRLILYLEARWLCGGLRVSQFMACYC